MVGNGRKLKKGRKQLVSQPTLPSQWMLCGRTCPSWPGMLLLSGGSGLACRVRYRAFTSTLQWNDVLCCDKGSVIQCSSAVLLQDVHVQCSAFGYWAVTCIVLYDAVQCCALRCAVQSSPVQWCTVCNVMQCSSLNRDKLARGVQINQTRLDSIILGSCWVQPKSENKTKRITYFEPVLTKN